MAGRDTPRFWAVRIPLVYGWFMVGKILVYKGTGGTSLSGKLRLWLVKRWQTRVCVCVRAMQLEMSWDDAEHPNISRLIWRFPKIGVPLNHPFLFEIFPEIDWPSNYWGTPMTMETPISPTFHPSEVVEWGWVKEDYYNAVMQPARRASGWGQGGHTKSWICYEKIQLWFMMVS